jgi:L-ascorbate metabolism protein UlaG (beta-lactamase superfamily)
MRIRRLGWAGIELESQGQTLVIDYVLGWKSIEPFIGPPRTPLLPSTKPGKAAGALVTHLHTDHTDASAISSALSPDASLYRPRTMEGEFMEVAGVAGAEEELATEGVPQVHAEAWDSFEIGPFTATALPAVDGFGDPQVSWLVEAEGKRVLHAGDTLFHGSWWLIQMRFGPLDAAFVPVNGANASFPHRQPASGIEASMTPEQAVAAARITGARKLVPIHYDGIHEPPVYEQTGEIMDRLEAAVGEVDDLELLVMDEGSTHEL